MYQIKNLLENDDIRVLTELGLLPSLNTCGI